MRLQKEANLTGYRNAWCSSALDLGDFFDFLGSWQIWKLVELEILDGNGDQCFYLDDP